MDVHINLDQSAQSEPRIRLQLAENLLRETQTLIHRLEVCTFPDIQKQPVKTVIYNETLPFFALHLKWRKHSLLYFYETTLVVMILI